jgi:[ribosomal protein S5]-alanine N-acetyltransferase
LPATTERLVIRPYSMGDLPAVIEIITHPEVFWWLPQRLDDEGAQRWLETEIREVEEQGTGTYAVVLRADQKVIGGVALKPRHLDTGCEVEIGYHLGRRWWGRGYATEAARAMLAEARSRGLVRVTAFIYPDNVASRAVAERLGMRVERRIQWAGLPHDVWAVNL